MNQNIEYFRRKILEWSKENIYEFTWRTTKNLWHVMVAEIMLQRTRANVVEKEFIKFTKLYPTPESYLNVENPNTFKNLGLPEREKIIEQIAWTLQKKKILNEKAHFLEIKGVGNYTAAAIRSMHLNMRDTIIDGNVIRVYTRFFGFEKSSRLYTDKGFFNFAEQITPKKNFRRYNFALLDFGREVCSPVPKCLNCPLRRKCYYYQRNFL
ncbi:A/G-specific DNA-adenine glycosylase [Fictibacillus enclensis]|uniref:HhH-GPD domain-containing protein n=1 Tax=Fictibacillus enclensis TaxID=1017270 RepID=A0A0V8JDQ8_9BACL|nr:hypothetical protein [Fictibacillus enclensis]KSU85166.1 hypothetical protein AS030_06515 [Fictibacillus enclensis]SCB92048.1 A/G-specific DNA-adenine glycosylase [Fictibacillus enclensis]